MKDYDLLKKKDMVKICARKYSSNFILKRKWGYFWRVKLFVSVCHYVSEKMYLSLNVNVCELLLNIIFSGEQINIFMRIET